MGTRGTGDAEGVLGEGVQDSTGVVQKLEGLPASVYDGRSDLEVPHSIDVDVGSRGLDRQARSSNDGGYSGDGDRIADDEGEWSIEGTGRHYEGGGGTEGDWEVILMRPRI